MTGDALLVDRTVLTSLTPIIVPIGIWAPGSFPPTPRRMTWAAFRLRELWVVPEPYETP